MPIRTRRSSTLGRPWLFGKKGRIRAVVHDVARARELRCGGNVAVEHDLDYRPADLLDDPDADLAAVRGGEEREGQDVRRARDRETRAQIGERGRARTSFSRPPAMMSTSPPCLIDRTMQAARRFASSSLPSRWTQFTSEGAFRRSI